MADELRIDDTIARIRAWLLMSGATNLSLAGAAGVDEKTIRQAQSKGWNPTVDTIRKLEALIPKDWKPGDPVPAKKARAA